LTFLVGGGRFIGLNLSERRNQAMSAEPFPKLLAKWEQGDLTTEQAIGQILQFSSVYPRDLTKRKKYFGIMSSFQKYQT
jgi:hypothetical protein